MSFVQFQAATLATPPSATQVATDLVGGSHFQKVKLDCGDPGETSPVTVGNGLPVRIMSPLSAFGELTTADLKPFVQGVGCYNRIPANFRTYTATGGTAVAASGMFQVSSGTSVGGYGVIRSLRALNYRPGMGGVARFTAAFDTNAVADSQQGAGLFNVGDALVFGYQGTEFGILYQHNGLVEVRTLTITVGAGGAETVTITLNGTAYAVPVTAGSAIATAQQISLWFAANVTAWEAYANAAVITFAAATDGPKSGSYTISSTGTTAGTYTTQTTGVLKTTDFIPQASWNVDPRPDIDPSKLNVFEISYQYLGGGDIFFRCENPETGRLELVHVIKLAGTLSIPSIGNPSMNLGIYSASVGSSGTSLTVKTASMAAFVQGSPDRTRNPRSVATTKTVSTTSTPLFTIRNRWIFGGVPNKIEIELDALNGFTESARGATIELYSGGTLTGAQFSYVNENDLVAEVDASATVLTGGTLLYSFVIGAGSSALANLHDMRVRVPAGLQITVAAKVNSGASSATGGSMTWYEDF